MRSASRSASGVAPLQAPRKSARPGSGARLLHPRMVFNANRGLLGRLLGLHLGLLLDFFEERARRRRQEQGDITKCFYGKSLGKPIMSSQPTVQALQAHAGLQHGDNLDAQRAALREQLCLLQAGFEIDFRGKEI